MTSVLGLDIENGTSFDDVEVLSALVQKDRDTILQSPSR